MDRFIGLDAHSSSCTFGVLNEKGKTLKTQVVETNGQSLVEFVRLIPGTRRLCLEECEQSQWLHEILSPHVDELVIVFGEKTRGNKNDGLDAVRLAERLRTGATGLKIYKAPAKMGRLRELARAYGMVTADLVRTKCRIKSFYRSRGIRTGTCQVFALKNREAMLGRLSTGARQAVEMLYQQLDFVHALKLQAHKAMVAEARKNPITKILGTAPGVGAIRSAQLLAMVVTPHRFRTSRQFWAYCGLGVVMHSSSDWEQLTDGRWVKAQIKKTRGLNRNYNRQVKAIFKGAATTVITKLPGDQLYQDYRRLLREKVKPSLAKLTIARKIAAITLAMWKRKETYKPDKYRTQ
jgi:transposase